MSTSDRREYLTATTLDQDFLDNSHDNLTNKLEMIVEIESPTGTIYASDRNKYVGTTFYEALLPLPLITRTVGEWLSNELEFSTLELEISNVDGRFNEFLPGGANFGGWIGKTVEVKLGISDKTSTYFTIFKGEVTEIGGAGRTVKSILIIARDTFDKLSVFFPTDVFKESDYPKIAENVKGLGKPIIYGNWTEAEHLVDRTASVPAFLVNGADPFIKINDTEVCTITIDSPAIITLTDHEYDADDPVKFATTGTLPTGIVAGTTYYAQPIDEDTFNISTVPAGALVNTGGTQSGEQTAQPAGPFVNLEFVISSTVLSTFDTTKVYLLRGSARTLIDSADITAVAGDNNAFEIIQDSGNTTVEGANFTFKDGDQFFVRVRGKALGIFNENLVAQAEDILLTHGGLIAGDFDANWTTFKTKASPAVSAITAIKSRVWIQENQPVLDFVLSMLEQVRLETFIDKNQKIKINSLHLDDFVASPTHNLFNWDIERDSFIPVIDDRNNFNRANGNYNFSPEGGENIRFTNFWKNTAATAQAGKEISKTIVFPNLYVRTDVENQLKEILKLASGYLEHINCTLTWRSLLKDVGDFVKLDITIGSTQFSDVPAMIREIGYDPVGMRIPVKLWSFQMIPFTGYAPGFTGIVGGDASTIVSE